MRYLCIKWVKVFEHLRRRLALKKFQTITNKHTEAYKQYRTFCTMDRAPALVHWPWLKLPQDPSGVPKLANFIVEITWSGRGHSSDNTGFNFLVTVESELHISKSTGWDSETCEHKLSICFVAKDNIVGSPPISSNRTRVLPLDVNHDRGTWYLQFHWYQKHVN